MLKGRAIDVVAVLLKPSLESLEGEKTLHEADSYAVFSPNEVFEWLQGRSQIELLYLSDVQKKT